MTSYLVYLTQMELPSTKAHSIQILKTCAALTHFGIPVKLVVKKGTLSVGEIEQTYGVDPVPSLLSVIESRRSLATLLSLRGGKTVFYTRSQRWARLAIRTRPLHRVPVVFETHRKAGIFKNDPETGIWEPRDRRERIEWIFRRADGVVCAVEATYRWLKSQGIRSLHLWYGWTHEGLFASGPPTSLAYAGTKNLSLLLEAFGYMPWAKLTVYGVPKELRKSLSVPSNVELKGFLPHVELLAEITKHGGFVATNEGIKLADYLSVGGLVFPPDLPSVREILGGGAIYFRFGNADFVADSIKMAVSYPRMCRFIFLNAQERRGEFLWPEKGMSLAGFICSIL